MYGGLNEPDMFEVYDIVGSHYFGVRSDKEARVNRRLDSLRKVFGKAVGSFEWGPTVRTSDLFDENKFKTGGLLEMFEAWGAQGRLYYIRYQYRDFIYPMIYTALMTGVLIRLIRPSSFNVWVLIPSVAMIFDFIENYYLRVLVYDFPNLNPINISMATLFSSLKWSFIAFSLILIFIAWYNRNKKYRHKHSSK